MIRLKLLNIKSGKSFYKIFNTEYEKQCFIRKSKYFKNILIRKWD